MTITPAQSRAARAILNLSQSAVGEQTSVGQARLSNFENPDKNFLLSSKPLIELEEFYTLKGIEFLDRDGIRRKAAGLAEFKGYEGFKEFIYDVYETVKHGGDVCVNNVDERQFEKWFGDYAKDYLSKMSEVEHLNFRILIQEGDDYFLASEYATYRTLPSIYFGSVPTYIYGSKKAEILFEDNAVTVFVMDNATLVDAQRKLFEIAWKQAGE